METKKEASKLNKAFEKTGTINIKDSATPKVVDLSKLAQEKLDRIHSYINLPFEKTSEELIKGVNKIIEGE